MMIKDEEFHRELRRAYMEGVTESRAAFASERRLAVDDFTTQIFGLRQEIRRALKLPPLAEPGNNEATLQ